MMARDLPDLVDIPENDYGIAPGMYSKADLSALLREQAGNPEAIWFIADMLED